MTATDELRAELTKRGVEWKAWDGTHPITVWHDETYLYEFIEYRLVNGAKQVNGCLSDNDGHCELTIKVFNCTPEQAIEATLGRGTCHITPKFTCSECGHQYPTRNYESYETCDGRTAFAPLGHYVLDCKKPNYCPQCGRRVKETYEC